MSGGKLIIRFRWWIISSFIAVSVFFGSFIPGATIDTDMTNMMPANMASRINTDKIEEMFGGLDLAMLVLETDDVLSSETLKRLESISKKMNRLKGVDQVMSLFDLKNIKGVNGAMIVDPAVKKIPENDREKEDLRIDLINNELVYEIVVSSDFKFTAIIVSIYEDVEDEYIIPAINEIIDQVPGDEKVIFGGMPFTRIEIDKSTKKDLGFLLPIALLVMVIFLYFSFRQIRGVILPFSVVIMSIMVAMGCIPLFGWEMNMTTILLPVMLIAIANDYGIHLIARFQEDNCEGNTKTPKELAKMMFKALARPVVLTGLTTMAGMLCLLGHAMIPAKQLGILSSIGILFALAASLLFIPAVTSLLKKPKPVIFSGTNKKSWLEKLLLGFGNIVTKKPKAILISALIFIIAAGSGILLLKIDANPENYFKEDHPVKASANIMNNKFGGSQNISMVISGDIKSPEIMNKIDFYDKEFEKIEGVGNTTTIARVVKKMSKAINDPGEEYYNTIPDSRNAIAQYFELYNMNGDPEDFERLVDFDYENTQLMVRINNGNTSVVNKVKKQIDAITHRDQNITLIGGYAIIFSEFAALVVNGQFISLLLSIIVVTIMLMILFRSLIAGLISSIPICIAMLILFGSMGFSGINLNVATAMLSSIMIGVGIDYTIHFLWRFKKEIQSGIGHEKAIIKTLITTGRGITINALSVIVGFAVLMASDFKPVQFYGFLVVVSILSCLIGALILIPALCMIIKPKFLEKP
ncbi:RND family transporter [Bacteroidota bacterium]